MVWSCHKWVLLQDVLADSLLVGLALLRQDELFRLGEAVLLGADVLLLGLGQIDAGLGRDDVILSAV